LHRNLLLLSFNDVPATKSIVGLSAPEAESIVEYFLATMYGGQEASYTMNGNMIESSMIPGSTGISPSPTIMQQQHQNDTYSNGTGNIIASLRTHSSKFPIERELILSTDKSGSKVPIKQYPRQIPTTPVAFNRSSISNGNGAASGVIQQFLPKSSTAVAPDHPTSKHAWNTQNVNQEKSQSSQMMTGAIPRAPTRLPEDVTALAEREMGGKDRDSKNAVSKTYHTLKDLISSKFKKDSAEMTPEELNNVTIQHQQNYTNDDITNTPYYNLMQQHMQLQQHQTQQGTWNAANGNHPQMWNGNRQLMRDSSVQITQQVDMNGQQVYPHMVATRASIHQHRAASQPQLNLPFKEHQADDRRGSLANIDVTDSDEGGFAHGKMWRPTNQQRPITSETPAQQILHQQQQNYLKRSTLAQQTQSQILSNGHYQPQIPPTSFHLHQQVMQQQNIPDGVYASQKVDLNRQEAQSHHGNSQDWNGMQRVNQETIRTSFNQDQPQLSQKGEKQVPPIPPAKPPQHQVKKAPNYEHPPKLEAKKSQPLETSTPNSNQTNAEHNGTKQVPGSAASSDYDKSGNHSSNVDSGRGSAAYSSGRKATLDTSPDHSDTPVPQSRPKSNDSEWIDIVDAELRHILEPGMQNMNIRPESTISGSLSSISPPLPPLSPDGSAQNTNDTNKHTTSSNTVTNKGGSSKQSAAPSQTSKKPEYGTDSYNRPGKNKFIGPSRGLPGSILQKRGEQMRSSISKKQEQSMMKRHLFGLDDLTSTTTRSLDLDSLLGGPWGAGQSVSDSETDTQGLRHIKSQLEGLETMYSEVLKMLGARPGRNDGHLRNARRRQGSLSSLPSSSVSGRPVRDRRRNDERRKVRDIKGINKRFQRLESHVVTLARSVAHLSSEMRSQHLVTQELEQLRQDLNFRMQNSHATKSADNLNESADGPNLTNPKRVKKLTKFFGEDPPLMRLFLKKLGYEKYAALFEQERVGMIELPYMGEERLQKLGVPLGPRLRILQEAQISLIKDKTLCIV
ncbi:CLUMA_CG018005, isoform A, partial [Clunio marinus]